MTRRRKSTLGGCPSHRFMIFCSLHNWVVGHIASFEHEQVFTCMINTCKTYIFFFPLLGVYGLPNQIFSTGTSDPPWVLHDSCNRRHWRYSNYACSDTWWMQSNSHTRFNWGASKPTLQVVKSTWHVSFSLFLFMEDGMGWR